MQITRFRNREPKVTPQSLQPAILCFGPFQDRDIGVADFALLARFACRPFGFAASGAGLLMFSLSIAFSFIGFSLRRVAIVTSITPVGRNCKQNLAEIRPLRRMPIGTKGQLAGMVPLLCTRQNQPDRAFCFNHPILKASPPR